MSEIVNDLDKTDIKRNGVFKTFLSTFRKTLLAIFIVVTSLMFRDSIITYIDLFLKDTTPKNIAHIKVIISIFLLLGAILLSIIWRQN